MDRRKIVPKIVAGMQMFSGFLRDGGATIISRVLSLIVAGGYVTAAYFGGGGLVAAQIGAALLLPLACIWFSEAMGDFAGSMGSSQVTAVSPDWMVAIGGWVLLLLPILLPLMFNAH